VQVDSINEAHRNSRYLSDFELPPTLSASTDVAEAIADAVVIFLALPAQKLPGFLAEHKALIPHDTLLCSLAKGLYLPSKSLLSKAMLEHLGRLEQPLAFLSGPSFAIEIMKAHPTAVRVC